jgi:hypothetical protein
MNMIPGFSQKLVRASKGGPAKYGGYAHFPGTGPQGKRCRDCEHFTEAGKRKRVCRKWAQLIGAPGKPEDWRGIDSAAAACKHFDAAKADA